MGAAVGVELQKPLDASDIRESGSLDIARGEVMKLRASLGKYASKAGFADVVFDATDLVRGENVSEDFERCVAEVAHIRRALKLSTQGERRRTRAVVEPVIHFEPAEDKAGRNSDSSSDDDEKK